MLKNILDLGGAQELSENEQKEITGGLKHTCGGSGWCRESSDCLEPFLGTAICINQCCAYVLV